MKLLLVFAWDDDRYSGGGAEDCFGIFDNLADALAVAVEFYGGDKGFRNVEIVGIEQSGNSYEFLKIGEVVRGEWRQLVTDDVLED